MKLKTRWIITSTVFLLPFISLLIAGLYWLWLNHFLFIWLIVTATLGLAGWFFSFRRPVSDKGLKHRRRFQPRTAKSIMIKPGKK